MAPKRKHTNSAAAAGRVTRSSTRQANAAVSPPAADPQPPKKKKAKTTTTTTKEQEAAVLINGANNKTIIIEHCKQCSAFKTRATQVKNGLEKSVDGGVNVLVNPDKPRRGCFEIREEGGGIFVSLLEMKRPFPPLKALDMEKVISDIVQKIQ